MPTKRGFARHGVRALIERGELGAQPLQRQELAAHRVHAQVTGRQCQAQRGAPLVAQVADPRQDETGVAEPAPAAAARLPGLEGESTEQHRRHDVTRSHDAQAPKQGFGRTTGPERSAPVRCR